MPAKISQCLVDPKQVMNIDVIVISNPTAQAGSH